MRKTNINELSRGQLVDCAQHIDVVYMDVMGEEVRRAKLIDTGDSLKAIVTDAKKYLEQGRFYNSDLHTYLEGQGVALPSRDRKPKKYGEVPPVLKFEKQASNG